MLLDTDCSVYKGGCGRVLRLCRGAPVIQNVLKAADAHCTWLGTIDAERSDTECSVYRTCLVPYSMLCWGPWLQNISVPTVLLLFLEGPWHCCGSGSTRICIVTTQKTDPHPSEKPDRSPKSKPGSCGGSQWSHGGSFWSMEAQNRAVGLTT